MKSKDQAPKVVAVCDRCQVRYDVPTAAWRQSQEEDTKSLVAAGWRVTYDMESGEPQDVCPKCCKDLAASLIKPEVQMDLLDNEQPWAGD